MSEFYSLINEQNVTFLDPIPISLNISTILVLNRVVTGAIIGDGDRNWVSFSVMGLSLSKKTNVLFSAKIAPYARDARACNC